jgi:hypothetical protein
LRGWIGKPCELNSGTREPHRDRQLSAADAVEAKSKKRRKEQVAKWNPPSDVQHWSLKLPNCKTNSWNLLQPQRSLVSRRIKTLRTTHDPTT